MADEQTSVTPVGESTQVVESAGTADAGTETTIPSMFDSLIGEETTTPDSSLESTNETADTSNSNENKEGETSSVSDVNANKIPDAIPYTRFTEVNEKYKAESEKVRQYEEFMNNPDMVAKYLQDNHKVQVQFGDTTQDNTPKTLPEINAKIKTLDVLDDNYADNLANLLELKDNLYQSNILQVLDNKRIENEVVSQQELILGDVFRDRPDAQSKAIEFVSNWSIKNPGVSFPFQGKEGWKMVDSFINGTSTNQLELGRQEAMNSLNTKRVLDSTNTQTQQPTGNAGYDIFASLY